MTTNQGGYRPPAGGGSSYPRDVSTTDVTTSDPVVVTETTTSTGTYGDASTGSGTGSTTEQGKQAARDVASSAQEQAKQVAAEGKAQARNLASQAQTQVRDQADQQRRRAVDKLHSLGDELGSMANKTEQPGPASDVVRQIADRTHDVAGWLDQREPGDVLDEIRSFARRRPGAFLLGCAVAGVVVGRLSRGLIDDKRSESDSSSSGDSWAVSTQPSTQQWTVESYAEPTPPPDPLNDPLNDPLAGQAGRLGDQSEGLR